MTHRSISVGLALLTSSLLWGAHSARAEGSDRPTAEALATGASMLAAQGDYVRACAKYAESERLDPSARRLLKMAECNEHLGKTASAWALYGEAQDWAEARDEAELALVAKQGALRLEANVGKIGIVVPRDADIDGLEVRRDGVLVPPAAFGLPVAVDPGPHVISATGANKRGWSANIGLTPGKATVTVSIPPLEDDHLFSSRDPYAASVPAALPEVDREKGKTQRTIGWVLGGAGVAGLAVGTLFALKARSTHDDLSEMCAESRCTSSAVDLIDRSRSEAAVANVSLLLGAASIVGGAVVYFTAPSMSTAERSSASLRIAPAILPSTAGLVATGAF